MRACKFLPLLVAALTVSACSDFMPSFRVGPLRTQAERMPPPADPYLASLAAGYRELGAEQYFEGDYHAAEIYYRKAIAAASGQALAPEDPGYWTRSTGLRARGVAGPELQEVVDMRSRLQAWIDNAKMRDPANAARQVVMYDCWIEELNEQEYGDAAACKPILAEGPAPTPPAAANCVANPDGLDERGRVCREGVIYFAWDRYDLLNPSETDRNQSVDAQAAALDLIVRQVKVIRPARIDVMGRADSSGPEEYNYGLSECRAKVVVMALKDRGMPDVPVEIIPLGETDLVVPTPDGVRDPANRVVMVAYQTNPNAPLARQPASRPKTDLFKCGSAKHPLPPRPAARGRR